MDMKKDIFADYPFGKIALKKIKPKEENFRLYSAGWMGDDPHDFQIMEVKGAVFRAATRGPNTGKLTIMVPGTKRTVYVTAKEMRDFEKRAARAISKGSPCSVTAA